MVNSFKKKQPTAAMANSGNSSNHNSTHPAHQTTATASTGVGAGTGTIVSASRARKCTCKRCQGVGHPNLACRQHLCLHPQPSNCPPGAAWNLSLPHSVQWQHTMEPHSMCMDSCDYVTHSGPQI